MGINLSGALILDAETGTAMSQDHQFLATAIAERYPDFRLCQIPMNDRSEVADTEFPFAIRHIPTGQIVVHFREQDMNINTIFEWLYMNDSAVHGEKNLYRNFLEAQAKEKRDADEAEREKVAAIIDKVAWIQFSPLHQPKVDGKRFGV